MYIKHWLDAKAFLMKKIREIQMIENIEPVNINASLLTEHETLLRKRLLHLFGWLAFAVLAYLVMPFISIPEKILSTSQFLLAGLFGLGVVISVIMYFSRKSKLDAFRVMSTRLAKLLSGGDAKEVKAFISDAKYRYQSNPLVTELFKRNEENLRQYSLQLQHLKLKKQLRLEVLEFELNCEKHVSALRNKSPIVIARNRVESSLAFLKQRRKELALNWEMAYQKFSWWNKLKYDETPDFSEMDKVISKLERMKRAIDEDYEHDFQLLEETLKDLKALAVSRVAEAKLKAEEFILNKTDESDETDLLKTSVWLSAISLPVSVWSDLSDASDIYDALRHVNGNYAEMTDTEIWWETLFLPSESLVGLASVAKGAYFEQLVASDTGGKLFEHFNNPDTDIVIDGVAYQLKATDSLSYLNTVDDGIPVISTSEVALASDSINSGYSNEELTTSVDLALGGTVVDIGDTTADAILTGIGGIGLLATAEGINHAAKKYENGGDALEAMFEGAGVAIEGTARALVSAAELGYKAITSKPSRFVGRSLWKGLEKIDQKLFSEPDAK